MDERKENNEIGGGLVALPDTEGWHWIQDEKSGRWTIIFIQKLDNDFLHLKKDELVVGTNSLETFFRLNRIRQFVHLPEPLADMPTPGEMIAAFKKILDSMIGDHAHAERKIGRKSWKTVADSQADQAQSLRGLLDGKGFLTELVIEARKGTKKRSK